MLLLLLTLIYSSYEFCAHLTYNNYCYNYYDIPTTWNSALEFCRSVLSPEANLISFNEDLSYVFNYFSTPNITFRTWTGYNKIDFVSDEYENSDGLFLNITNLPPLSTTTYNPDTEHCTEYVSSELIPKRCTETTFFLCRYSLTDLSVWSNVLYEPVSREISCSINDSLRCPLKYSVCFGEGYNTSNVCSAHGKCSSYNKCVCEDNYEGEDCSCEGSASNQYCYDFQGHGTFTEALYYCWGRNMDLVTIENEAQNVYLSETFGHLPLFWIGLNDIYRQGEYYYTNNVGYGYTSWGIGEPFLADVANRCTLFLNVPELYKGSWAKANCMTKNSYICAKKICNNVHKCDIDHKWRNVVYDLYNNTIVCNISDNECPEVLSKCWGERYNSTDVCNAHGKCIALDTCKCDEMFGTEDMDELSCSLAYCQNRLENDGLICSGNGNCNASDHRCYCYKGVGDSLLWVGDNCSIPICFNKTEGECSNRGVCLDDHTCECQKNWTGVECEIPKCWGISAEDSNVCSGNGNCTNENTCACDELHKDNDCQYRKCFGDNYCVYGNCTINDCVCEDDFFGDLCQYPKCYDKSQDRCSNHGTCLLNHTCSCEENWNGIECGIPKCNGVSKLDNNVCNQRGNCTLENICLCFNTTRFTGDFCEYTICYGEYLNPCNNNGVCIENNTCSCYDGYDGKECEYTVCDGVSSSDKDKVCSGNGDCLEGESGNYCECTNILFEGELCDLPKCYGKNHTDYCSQKGFCSQKHKCECFKNYFGDECEFTTCFGIRTDEIYDIICSDNGECIDFDKCECNKGYTGTKCQKSTKPKSTDEQIAFYVTFIIVFFSLLIIGLCIAISVRVFEKSEEKKEERYRSDLKAQKELEEYYK